MDRGNKLLIDNYKKRKIQILTSFLLTLLFLGNALAQTDVYLKIYSKTFQRMEIDLYPFAGGLDPSSEVLASMIYEVLGTDLWRSGFFTVNKKQGAPPLGGNGNGTSGIINSRSVARLNGGFIIDNNTVSIRPNLVDSKSGRVILRSNYTAIAGRERNIAHKIADEIVYSLTGEHGIANSRIAYIKAVTPDKKEIAVMDYDGKHAAVATKDNSINLSPVWSPDGKKVCYSSYKDGNLNIYIVNLATQNQLKLAAHQGLNSAPAWSSDGKKIAMTLSKDGNAEIYLLNYETRKLKRLTYNNAIDSSPTWSPSNRELAFTSGRSGLPQVYIMDTEGLNVRRLTFEGSYNDSPAWSPRGDKIAYVSRTASGFDIYSIDVTGENRMRLTDSSRSNEDPYWSPNGFSLVFSSNRTGKKEIYFMFWDGTDQKQLTSGGGNYSPSWSPRLNF